MNILEVISTLGPCRRADVTVIEMVLSTEPSEAHALEHIALELQNLLPRKLESLGLIIDPARWSVMGTRSEPIARVAGFVCETALRLQSAAGHDLLFQDFLQDQNPVTHQNRYRFIFQHDDKTTGEQAFDLAMRIANETCPELQWKAELHDPSLALPDCIDEFVRDACLLVTPPETLGLIAAAKMKGIPTLRLEREPYGPLTTGFRVAPNGMVMLGHSRYRVLMDGLFCIDRPGPGFNIMKDRRAMWHLLADLGAPGAVTDASLLMAATPSRAKRVARRLGYPVNIRSLQRDPYAPGGRKANSESELEQQFSTVAVSTGSHIIEPVLPGRTLDLVFAGGKLLEAKLAGQDFAPDSALVSLALGIEKAVNAGFLWIQMKEIAAETGANEGFVVSDIDPSPPLVELLGGDQELLDRAYAQFLDWLYPIGSSSRIPIVSITGTNGKTTTCNMISRIAGAESLFVGMASTTGVYFDGKLKDYGDRSGFYGHCMVFENANVDLAVLETARGDVLRSGFAFDYSDVAACSNVAADHIGQHGIDSLEQMAVVKRSILERARGPVVLNGDDPLCLQMIPFLTGSKLYLSSFKLTPAQLRAKTRTDASVINVEVRHGEEWIVLHVQEESHAVIRVNDIPATFNGIARHNISNAMHAIGVASAMNYKPDSMRHALKQFRMSFETLPGRLNIHDNGRFQIIMDNAHNADGIRQLVKFTDQYPCKGRKILRLMVSPNASEAEAHAAATAAAGHFDHYICTVASDKQSAGPFDIKEALKQGLLDHGVATTCIETLSEPERSVEYPASLCQPDDLLVLATSNATLPETWEKILQT